MRHNIHIRFHDDRVRHLSNIKVFISTIFEAAVFVHVLLEGGICEICRLGGDGVQVILRYFLKNLRGSNVGIAYGRNL
jgi:hypothetical protein